MDISIAICTYRRATLLPTTLASLAAINRGSLPAIQWEVMVVDNGCEAVVEQIVRDFQSRLPIRYEREPAVGVSHARNKAMQCAKAPIVLFTDDDVLFDSEWLGAMWRTIVRNGEYDFWGGRVLPAWESPPPQWFDVERCPMLGDSVVKWDRGAVPRAWNPASPDNDPPFYTANLAVRAAAVAGVGGFDVRFGHSGFALFGGEDSWLIRSIHRAGGRGWYAADALVHHPVDPKRLTKSYARRFAWRQGAAGVEMLRRENAGRIPRWLYRFAAGQVLRGCGRMIAGWMCHNPGLAFAGQYQMLFNLSKLRHACGCAPR